MLVAIAGCQQAPIRPSPTPSARPSASALAACPASLAPAGPQVVLKNLPAPDDLAFDGEGRLLFSDIKTGTVSELNTDGTVERVVSGLNAPEGIVVQNDGHILVAEQGRNRIVAIDPQSHAVSPWHTFVNHTTNGGIDGIGPILPPKDSNGQSLPNGNDVIVPDSPNGVVWEVTPDGKTATLIAGGMTRPAGAGIDANGHIFIADEAGAVWALDPVKHRFATLPTPDDVLVAKNGHVFVNTLGDNKIHELGAQGHQLATISGLQQPQGIALDGADNLFYTEFTGGRIGRVVRTFTLDPPKVSALGGDKFLICPSIRRAAGFTLALGLTTGSSLQTSVLNVVQPEKDSSGALEVETTEHTISIVVEGSDGTNSYGLLQTIPLSP